MFYPGRKYSKERGEKKKESLLERTGALTDIDTQLHSVHIRNVYIVMDVFAFVFVMETQS